AWCAGIGARSSEAATGQISAPDSAWVPRLEIDHVVVVPATAAAKTVASSGERQMFMAHTKTTTLSPTALLGCLVPGPGGGGGCGVIGLWLHAASRSTSAQRPDRSGRPCSGRFPGSGRRPS